METCFFSIFYFKNIEIHYKIILKGNLFLYICFFLFN
jgi:hypothetical protein